MGLYIYNVGSYCVAITLLSAVVEFPCARRLLYSPRATRRLIRVASTHLNLSLRRPCFHPHRPKPRRCVAVSRVTFVGKASCGRLEELPLLYNYTLDPLGLDLKVDLSSTLGTRGVVGELIQTCALKHGCHICA